MVERFHGKEEVTGSIPVRGSMCYNPAQITIPIMKLQKYLAELIGTFFLTLAVSLSLLYTAPLATPLIAGITLGLFVFTVGSISGAHLNPAVTIGLASIRKISLKDAALYIVAQIIGALLAMLAVKGLSGQGLEILADNKITTGIAEAIGAFILIFGVSSLVHEKADGDVSGLIVGSSLFLGISLTSGFSNGVLNPAVAIGIGSISAMYLLAPIVGTVAGAWIYKLLIKK